LITLRKLQSLKEGTRQRKEVLLLKEMEDLLLKGKTPDGVYLKGLLQLTACDLGVDPPVFPSHAQDLLQLCNDLRHLMLVQLGQEPADWDFTARFDAEGQRDVLPLRVYLDDIRSPFNVGSIFRTAEAMGAQEVLLSPGTAPPDHPRAKRTSMGAVDILPWRVLEPEKIPVPCFALESGGKPVDQFSFPAAGTVILGSEELGVRPSLLQKAEQSAGRVSIPMRGRKGSLNVGVAFGILMQMWMVDIL